MLACVRGSKAAKGHKTYPYLLGALRIDRPNQVWCRDITVSGAQRLPDLVAILNAQAQSRWTDLLGEGVGSLARELVEKAAPVPDLVECFGE